jgi:UDP-N-acetylglucosamine transferase subunit ALG13
LIFLTVGTQLPFDRLASALDHWASMHPGMEIVAQVGPTERRFPSMRAREFLSPGEFEDYFARAELVIAHAGMGTILAAADAQKPLVVMPRRASLGEHRNDHQLATATRLEGRLGLAVAWTESDLDARISAALADPLASTPRTSPYADARLIDFVRSFVANGRVECAPRS